MRYRHLVAIVPTALAAFALVAPASAAPTYPPGGPGALQATATRVKPGGSVTLSGSGFAPGGKITISTSRSAQALGGGGGRGALFAAAPRAWLAPTGVVATVNANSSGVATAKIKLSQPGTWIVTFRGPNASGGVRVLKTRIVVAGSTDQAGGLAKTGVDLTFLWAGLGLLVAGGVLVALTRVRRRARV